MTNPHPDPVQPASGRLRYRFLRYLLPAVIVVGLGVILAVLARRPQTASLTPARLAADPTLGTASARVTIIEFGDFGCPTCRAWEQAGVRQQLMQTYGDRVSFVWRDYPIITAQSPKAAEAGQCAFDQGKFWEYHDLLYQHAPALSVPELKTYAADLGLDSARFDRCLDSGQDAAKVNQSLQEGRQLGFPGTPSFLINGQKLVGPPSYDTLKNLVDTLLAAGG